MAKVHFSFICCNAVNMVCKHCRVVSRLKTSKILWKLSFYVCVYTYTDSIHVYTAAPTMWCDDLCRLGWSSYIPCGQSAVGVAADKLFTLMVPGYRVDRLKDTQQHITAERGGCANSTADTVCGDSAAAGRLIPFCFT